MEVVFSPQAPIGIKKKVRISDELDIKFQDPTISSSTDSNSIPILFEDSFIKITECFLTIKDYFYPSALPVHIDFEKITSIKCEKQDESSSAKTWGIDNENDCWWAKDAFRNARTDSEGYNVIITCNGKHMGFTVFDIHDFIDVLKPLLNDDVQISRDSAAGEMNNSKCSDGRAAQEAGGSKERDMHANSKSKNASKSKSKSGSKMSIINKSGKRFKASAEALRDKITKKQNSKISGVSGGAEISAPPSKQSKLGRKSKEKATVSIEKKHPQQLLAVANGNANGGDKSKDQQQQQPFMPRDKEKDKKKIYSVKEAEKNNQMSVFEPIKGNVSPYQCKQRTVELKWKHKNGEKSSGTLDEAMGSSQTSAPAVNMDTVNKYRTQMQTVQRKKDTKERLSDEEEELDREMKHIKRMLEVIRMKEAAEQACGTETSNLNNWLNATGGAADANTPNETIHRLAFSMTQCVTGRKLCTLTAADGEMRLFAVRKEKPVPMIHAYIMLNKKQVAEIIKK